MAIRLLSVLLVIVLVMFTFYVLVAEDVLDFSPPYPSEETPLTLETWGVSWEREYDIYIGDVLGLNYSAMSISITRHWGSWSIGASGPLHAEFIDMDTFVPPTTVEALDELDNIAWEGVSWVDGQEVHIFTCYYISDDTDPLRFNMGDSIAFVHFTFLDGAFSAHGFEDDIVYEIGLMWDEGRSISQGWGFAVHDGDLYSWVDHGPVDDPLS